jgi:hypothetical protein
VGDIEVELTNLLASIKYRVKDVHETYTTPNCEGVLLGVDGDIAKGRQINLHSSLQLGQRRRESMLCRAC